MSNNFEKDVQQKLEGMQMQPSDRVWATVAPTLMRKVRRRRGFVWILAAALLIGGGIYWIYADQQEPGAAAVKKQETIPTEVPQTTAGSPVDHEPKTINLIQQQDQLPPVNSTTLQRPRHSDAGATAVARRATPLHATRVKLNNPTATVSPVSKEETETTGAKTFQTKTSTREERPLLSQDVTEIGPDSSRVKTDPVSPALTVDSVAKLQVVPPSVPGVEGKPLLRLVFGAGRNGIANPLFGNMQKDALSSGSGPQPPPPSEEEAGFFTKIGAQAVKLLGQRWQVGAGLQYELMTTRRKTGMMVVQDVRFNNGSRDLSLGSYYANALPGSAKTYRNYYHLLSLPLSVGWQLSENSPIRLEGSVAPAYLLHTNALVFSNSLQGFYKDPSAFRKVQLYSGLALSYQKGNLSIGPKVHYGLTGFRKESESRFLGVGIHAGMKLR